MVVAICNKHFLCNIFFSATHTWNASATTPLKLICVWLLTLDITKFCKRKDTIFFWNKVFYIDFTADSNNLCAAFIVIFFLDSKSLFFDDRKKSFTILENVFEIGYLDVKLSKLVLNLGTL